MSGFGLSVLPKAYLQISLDAEIVSAFSCQFSKADF